jgi:TPR repeat protein
LAECYQDGKGVDQNEQEAIRLIRAAALQNHQPAQRVLGKCYQKGEGVERNMLKAACLFKTAAENRHQDALEELKELGLNEVTLAVCL